MRPEGGRCFCGQAHALNRRALAMVTHRFSVKLTQRAEYALRTMAQLAIETDGTRIRAKDLANKTEIPPHYLSKLLRKLVVAGLLASVKGHGGGFTLARQASAIRLIDVLRAVEAPCATPHCAFGWARCTNEAPCPLHPLWMQLTESFEAWANQRTLADLQRCWVGYGHLSALASSK